MPPSRTDRRWTLAVLAAIALASGPASAATTLRIPGKVDPAVLWADYRAHITIDQHGASNKVIERLWNNRDAEHCRADRAALDQALLTEPVSLSLWNLSSACAELTGDHARSERDAAALTALVRYAYQQAPLSAIETPLQVTGLFDVYTLKDLTGGELLYQRYATDAINCDLKVELELWDETEQRERRILASFMGSLVAMSRDEPVNEGPMLRIALARSVIAGGKDLAADSPLHVAWELQQAVDLDDPKAQRARLAELAAGDDPGARLTFAERCLLLGDVDCGSAAVDALLPLAERHYAQALWLLSRAYRDGIGVAKDPAAADRLRAAADQRWGNGLVASLEALIDIAQPKRVGADWQARIDAALASGTPYDIALARQLQVIHGVKDAAHPSAAEMRAAADRGSTVVETLYALSIVDEKDNPDAERYLRRAAEHGNPIAASLLSKKLADSARITDQADSQRFQRIAADHGDLASAQALYKRYADPKTPAEAAQYETWLFAATLRGDKAATLALGKYFADASKEMLGDPVRAVTTLGMLVDAPDQDEARHALATLLMREDKNLRDLPRARRLLQQDADKGDVGAEALLGFSYLVEEKPEDLDRAINWLELASTGGNYAASHLLGALHYDGTRMPRNGKLAVSYYRKSIEQGNARGRNELAWIECTSTADDLYAPDDGLAVAKQMDSGDYGGNAAVLDTIAACHAANGEFDQALTWERMAIATGEAANYPRIAELRQHLDLWQHGQALRE